MKTLLIPTLVWCVCTTGFAATEALVLPLTLAPVCVPVVEAPPRKVEGKRAGDRLEGLRQELGGLAERLVETDKAVEEMARQRNEARENAKQSNEAQRMAMAEAAALRKELAAALEKSAQWESKSATLEEKMKDGALAHQELQKFRGELQGAMKEFEALKDDLGKARGELQDPVERASLKKEAVKLKEDREQLGSEIEVALAAKIREEKRAQQMQSGLEEKLRKVALELSGAKKELSGMAKLKAEHEGAMADVGAMKQELKGFAEKNALLKQELATQKRAMASDEAKWEETMVSLDLTMKRDRESRDKLSDEKEALAEELATFKEALAEKEAQVELDASKISMLKKAAEKPRQELMKSEESRRQVTEQMEEAQAVAAKVSSELAMSKKANIGFQELLFRKTDEVRGLKKQVKALEEAVKNAEAQPSAGEQDSAAELVERR